MPRSVPYDDYLIESLKDRRLAEAYVNAALEEDELRVFLLALRNVAQARGMTRLATWSKLNRESLYKMLSKRHLAAEQREQHRWHGRLGQYNF